MKTAEEASKSESENIASDLECLKIRSDEDKDTELFGAPPPREDCPICFLPMPFSPADSMYMACCGNSICCGCIHENRRVIEEMNKKNARRKNRRPPLQLMCPFCRMPDPVNVNEVMERLEKRMALNDAGAFFDMGQLYEHGYGGISKDGQKAFELCLCAAELGHGAACTCIARYYREGQVIEKDDTRVRMYIEMGAKNGYIGARHNLGCIEAVNGNIGLARKHFLISAGAGHQLSLDRIKQMYQKGLAGKDTYASALRAFQTTRKEEWSKERDNWAAIRDAKNG